MMSMPSLPPELLLKIAHSSELCGPDLRQLRAVNRTFHNLVSRDAFAKLTVTATVKSAGGLHNILNTPTLAAYVQEIEFEEDMPTRMAENRSPAGNGHENSGRKLGKCDDCFVYWWRSRQSQPSQAQDHHKWSELRLIMASAYSLLHKAPFLHSIVFEFSPVFKEHAWDEDNFQPSDHLQLHWAILGAIANNPRPLPALRSLALHNMLPFANDIYDTKYFTKIIGALHDFHICAVGDEIAEDDFYQDPAPNFWEQVHLRLLLPANELRSLHIASKATLGVMPPLDFTVLTYPHLQSLSLMGVLFDGQQPIEAGTEDFLARHGKTLRRLKLVGCAITHVYHEVPERVWSMLWRRYEQELELLSELFVEFQRDDPDAVWALPRTEPQLRYCFALPSAGAGVMPDFGDVPGEEEDTPALASLQAVVAGRREATSSAST
ncbi:hypothetical protein FA95DRAFT_1557230, partial [Auriscalpium vulgare]